MKSVTGRAITINDCCRAVFLEVFGTTTPWFTPWYNPLVYISIAVEHTQMTNENFASTYTSNDSMTDDDDGICEWEYKREYVVKSAIGNDEIDE